MGDPLRKDTPKFRGPAASCKVRYTLFGCSPDLGSFPHPDERETPATKMPQQKRNTCHQPSRLFQSASFSAYCRNRTNALRFLQSLCPANYRLTPCIPKLNLTVHCWFLRIWQHVSPQTAFSKKFALPTWAPAPGWPHLGKSRWPLHPGRDIHSVHEAGSIKGILDTSPSGWALLCLGGFLGEQHGAAADASCESRLGIVADLRSC